MLWAATRPRADPERCTVGQHRLERRRDRVEALGRDEDPQQRRARVPALDRRAGAGQRLLERRRDLVRRAAGQERRHGSGDRERLAGGVEPTGGEALERGRDACRATGVVKTADDELALQARRERLVGIAELRERPFEDVHGLHPPKQGRVRLGDLQRGSRRARAARRPAAAPPPGARTPSRARRSPPRAPSHAGRRPARAGGGGSASARPSRSAAACGAPLCIAACAASRRRASTQGSPDRTDTDEMRADLSCAGPHRRGAGGRRCDGRRRARRCPATPRWHRGRPDGRSAEGRRRPAPPGERGRRPAARPRPISTAAIAAAWRSAHPSPSTASACAKPSACGSRPRTRATTRRAISSVPATRSTAGSSAAGAGSSNASARSSSVRYSGLPPLAVQTAEHSSSLARPPVAARTIAVVAASLNSAGRTTIAASARSASSGTPVNAGSSGRSATSKDSSQPLEPRRDVGQPPQRGLVRPVRVIDGDQQRSSGRKIGGEPVQAVQDGERRVVGRRVDRLAQEQRPHRGSGSGQERCTLSTVGACQAPLEELAHDAEREVPFELGPARSQDLVAEPLCLPARRVDQRRLADTRPPLDDERPAAAFQQRVHRRELAFALDQLVHGTTLDPPRRAGEPTVCERCARLSAQQGSPRSSSSGASPCPVGGRGGRGLREAGGCACC